MIYREILIFRFEFVLFCCFVFLIVVCLVLDFIIYLILNFLIMIDKIWNFDRKFLVFDIYIFKKVVYIIFLIKFVDLILIFL